MAQIPRPRDLPEPPALRPSEGLKERAIRAEVVKRVGDKYDLSWIDKTLGYESHDEMPWFYKAATWLPGRAIPAVGKGIGEFAGDMWSMLNTVDAEHIYGTDPVTGKPKKTFGADLAGRQLFGMLKSDFGAFWDKDQQQILADYQTALRAFGPEAEVTRIASQRLAERNKEWSENSFSMAMIKDFNQKYGGWSAFSDTLYDRPDKILVDLADVGAIKLTPLAGILRKATKGNALSVIDEAREWIKYSDEFDKADEVNNLLGHMERNIKLTPDLLADAKPMQDRVTGNTLTIEQIDAWNDDPEIFYRVTEPNRMHQQYSVVVAEERRVEFALSELIDERVKEQYADEIAELQRQVDNGEIFYADFDDEIEGFRQEFIEDNPYLLPEVENKLGRPMGIEEANISGEDPFLVYPGPNAVRTLDEALEIASDEGWDWTNRQFETPGVIQVIKGTNTGETFDLDGIVFSPEETVAVFDIPEFAKGLETLKPLK